MFASELLGIIREDFLDDAITSDDGDDASARFSNSMLLRALGEAQRQACYRQDLRHLFDTTTTEICDITLEDGVAAYELDSRILRIETARLPDAVNDTIPLDHLSREWFDLCKASWRTAESGTPKRFFIIGRTLYLDPPPALGYSGSTLHLSVWREPLESTLDLDSELEWTQDPEKLGHWVAFKAFLKPDEDTQNSKLAADHRALFDAAFGIEVPVRARADLLSFPSTFSPFDPGGCVASMAPSYNFETEV